MKIQSQVTGMLGKLFLKLIPEKFYEVRLFANSQIIREEIDVMEELK